MKSREISKAGRVNPRGQRRRANWPGKARGLEAPAGPGAQGWGGAGNKDSTQTRLKAATGPRVPGHIQGSQKTITSAPRQECSDAPSCLTLCDPWTVAHQAPLSMGFSRQEYWSGLLCPSPGDLPNPGIKPQAHALQADSLPSKPRGNLNKNDNQGSWYIWGKQTWKENIKQNKGTQRNRNKKPNKTSTKKTYYNTRTGLEKITSV